MKTHATKTKRTASLQKMARLGAISIALATIQLSQTFAQLADGTYKITARHSNKVLDVPGSSSTNGIQLQQYTSNGSIAQQWILESVGSGLYAIKTAINNKAVAVDNTVNNGLNDGNKVILMDYTGANNQKWSLVATSAGYYQVRNVNSNKVVDVSNVSTSDGALIHQWTGYSNDNQQFKFDLVSTISNIVTTRGDNAATGEGIDKLTDENTATKWLDFSATSWVQFSYSTSKSWNKYDITSGNDYPERDPKNWTIKGSNDGTTWTTVDTRTNQTWSARNQTKTYTIDNTTAYNYYRWEISANGSGNIIQVSEFTFGNAAASATTAITVRARSVNNAGANMVLEVMDQAVATGGTVQQTRTQTNLSTSFTDYTFTLDGSVPANRIRARFNNDSNMDFEVDYIIVGGTIYQTEATTTYAVGNWDAGSNGCNNAGYFGISTLHCNGYFHYNLGGTPPVTPTPSVPSGSNAIGMNVGMMGETKMFADAWKSASNWRQMNSNDAPPLDAQGWPLTDAQIYLVENEDNMHGTYKLSFTGQANVSIALVGGSVSNNIYNAATNTSTVDIVCTSTEKVYFVVQFTNTNGGVKNIKMMRPRTPGSTQSYTNEVFTDAFLAALAPFSVLRTMDFTSTNANQQVNWSDRVNPTMASQAQWDSQAGYGWQGKGGAWEWVVMMANASNKDIWICIPAKANNDYITKMAQLFKYGSNGVTPYTSAQANPVYPPLNSNLKIYLEYSNELWNSASAFTQFHDNHNAAVAEVNAGGSPLNYDGEPINWIWTWRRVAQKTVEATNIFRQVWSEPAIMTTIRPVLEWQQDNGQGTGEAVLLFMEGYYNNPAKVSNPHPVSYYIYGGGGSGYYGPDTHSDNLTLDNIWSSNDYDVNHWKQACDNDADLCATFGIKRIAYEGGPSQDNWGHSVPTLAAAVNDPRMRTNIVNHHTMWSNMGGDLLMYFTIVADFQWGFLDNIYNLNKPKFQAMQDLAAGTRQPVTWGAAVPATLPGNQPSYSLLQWGGTWASYTFHVDNAGTYNFRADLNSGSTSVAELYVDANLIATHNVSASAGFITPATSVYLSPGMHSVRVNRKSGSFGINSVIIGAGSGRQGNDDLATTPEIEMFPNPASQEVTVIANGEAVISLYTMMGTKVVSKFAQNGAASFNISTLPTGIYNVEVTQNAKRTFKKLVIE